MGLLASGILDDEPETARRKLDGITGKVDQGLHDRIRGSM
ncbi:hypothetical protein [Leptolyngbya ohadii]|nr:hypothetical protein [Leptolyngbya ohadii]